jgi:hypothetical protein
MGTTLTGLTPATTYDALIKVGDNGPITASLKVLSDGLGTNLPMEASTTGINFTGALQQSGVAVPTAGQVAAKQDTLVSGTNIKTINGATVLGSGNIVTPQPSGVSGAIQFSNGSAFASDAANLFWDDTNNRLGVLTNTPSFPVDVAGEIRSTTQVSAGTTGTNGAFLLRRTTDGNSVGSFSTSGNEVLITEFSGSGGRLVTGFATTALKWLGSSSQPRVGIGFNGSILATAHIQGSGSTSATTSLLVQNSASEEAFRIYDNRLVVIGTTIQSDNFSIGQSNANLKGINQSGSRIQINYVNGGGVKFSNSSSGFATFIVGEVSENMVSFGGITSAFPALKRSTTNLQVRLADDSGYAPIDASLYKVGGTNGFTGTGSYTNFTIVGGIITNAS